jgi:hypothetical protein
LVPNIDGTFTSCEIQINFDVKNPG